MVDNKIQIEVKSLKSKAKGISLLYVEDEKLLREKTASFLNKIFTHLDIAIDGKAGLEKYLQRQYDIVITDVLMPNMNGLELISNIREHNEKQEIIIISAYAELSYLIDSIKLGVTGYLIKPLDLLDVIRVLNQSVEKIQAFRKVEMYQKKLEEMVDKRTKEIVELQKKQLINYEYAIGSLVKMMELRDTYTSGHGERVAKYSKEIAKKIGCSEEECNLIYQAGILHDIGKIITPDSILLKPGKLTEAEYSLIKEHVTVGYEILHEVPMYKHLADIVYSHHEDYDGGGYPRSLKGNEIPLFSRILAIADTFDAITTSRIYKNKKNISQAIKELKELAGTRYDPSLIDSAIHVFQAVDLNESVSQNPKSHIDDERFAYFFKDPLTKVYNNDYLDFILSKNIGAKNFECCNIIYLQNFTAYNRKHGWNRGDIFLKDFADYLQSEFSDSHIFRIFGDDFFLLNNTHQDLNLDKINASYLLKTSKLQCTHKHFDLREVSFDSYQTFIENMKVH
ncbi:MAG: putative nucleotidyltransferase with HDIG domain [Sulfurimonas sp.]|jgi:putative nucleotidyltransferase with HDIG domain|uniref:HD domain-containing phosphohydrolase n=1 Tax=Sulfurimonas sp. TaxID=2022749 RepID=UPI0039E3104B